MDELGVVDDFLGQLDGAVVPDISANVDRRGAAADSCEL